MAFDDPNLGAMAMAQAQRAGIANLVAERLTLKAERGVNAHLSSQHWWAGGDSIDDVDVLRHGWMGQLFSGVRFPSTLGTFLCKFPSVTSATSTSSPPGSPL